MKKNKYNAKKVEYNGIKFDSAFELKCWQYLKKLESEGKIKDLNRQIKFELLPANSVYRALNYVADFTFFVNDRYIVADAKGYITTEFKIKQKIFYDKYGNQIYVFKKLSDVDKIIDMTKWQTMMK